MALMTAQLLKPLQPAHQFDEAALLRYATANVEGFPSPSQLARFSVTQFGHGQSNPTFCLEAVSNGTPPVVKRYVLRKKPPGVILQSAHAVEREFQVSSFFFFFFYFSKARLG
jgi:acyl-CoA dehydrogenase